LLFCFKKLATGNRLDFILYSLTLFKKFLTWHCGAHIVPATQEAEAGASLDPKSLRPSWAMQQEPISKTSK
jgi:hypothetical protein